MPPEHRNLSARKQKVIAVAFSFDIMVKITRKMYLDYIMIALFILLKAGLWWRLSKSFWGNAGYHRSNGAFKNKETWKVCPANKTLNSVIDLIP